jgi:hypothetical protein
LVSFLPILPPLYSLTPLQEGQFANVSVQPWGETVDYAANALLSPIKPPKNAMEVGNYFKHIMKTEFFRWSHLSSSVKFLTILLKKWAKPNL